MENIIKELDIIKKGTRIVASCVDYNHEGQGVCKISGVKDGEEVTNFPVFVNNMLLEEKGQLEITKVSKTYAYANIVKIYNDTKSTSRVRPNCPNYDKCGGCNIMHMDYSSQLQFKTKMVKDTLRKLGSLDNVEVLPTIGMKNPDKYRNKVQVPFRKTFYKTICGFFAKDSHNVVPLTDCMIQPDISTSIIHFVRNLCNEFKIDGYVEETNCGLIRHLLVRTNHDLSEIMIVFVLTKKDLPYKEEIISKIIKRYPNVTSIIINVNDKAGNTILGKECHTIFGNDYINDTLCELEFRIGPKSFYQVNHEQTEKLYRKAIEYAELKDTDILIDAYCGIGTIGLIASKYVKEVYGVEIVDEAIKNAKVNAKANKIKNANFVCNKAEDQIIKWRNDGVNANVIVVDPPRKGCDIKLLNTIEEMDIEKVVYVSCDPATLARDLKILCEKGYYVKTVQPVDMFPFTSNVETVVLLSHKSNNSKVNVNLNFDNEKGKKLIKKVVEDVDSRKEPE